MKAATLLEVHGIVHDEAHMPMSAVLHCALPATSRLFLQAQNFTVTVLSVSNICTVKTNGL